MSSMATLCRFCVGASIFASFGCLNDVPGGPTPSDPMTGVWSVLPGGADSSACTSLVEFSHDESLTMNVGGTPNEAADEYLLQLGVTLEGEYHLLTMDCLRGATSLDPTLESREFYCWATTEELLYQPDPAVDAYWLLDISLVGKFHEWLTCGDNEHKYDYTGFQDGVISATVGDNCVGSMCDQSEAPQNTLGEPLCLNSTTVTSKWEGCAADGNLCLDVYEGDVICP